MTDEKLLAVVKNDLSVFSEVERLVIELADAMADTPSNISDDLYARLREKFSEEQLFQLGGQLAFENYRARLNRVFDVGSDELYKPQINAINSSVRFSSSSGVRGQSFFNRRERARSASSLPPVWHVGQ